MWKSCPSDCKRLCIFHLRIGYADVAGVWLGIWKRGYRGRCPCYASPMSRLVRQVSTFMFVHYCGLFLYVPFSSSSLLNCNGTQNRKKNPILPTSSYVTLKHITSPDVRCPSVNTHNFKIKTNGPSIDTVWEVGVSASVIRIAQRSYSVKFVKNLI